MRGKFYIKLVFVVLFIFFVINDINAAGPDDFDIQTIPLENSPNGVYPIKYDNIKGSELLVIHSNGSNDRKMQIFKQGVGLKYDTQPLSELPLPPMVFAMQIIDYDKDNREEALLIALDAIYLLDKQDKSNELVLSKLVSYEMLFSIPEPQFIYNSEFLFDLNQDGIWEIIIPCWQGACLLVRENGKYLIKKKFNINLNSHSHITENHLSSTTVLGSRFSFPKIKTHDINSDKNIDLFFETDNGLELFYQNGNLKFSDVANKHIALKSDYLNELHFYSSDIADLNGDGLVDYVRALTIGDITNPRTIVEIYLANILDGYPLRPSKRMVFDELATGLLLSDLNEDGSHSLILTTMQVGMASMVKSMMLKRIPLQVRVFSSSSGFDIGQHVLEKKVSCQLNLFQHYPAHFIGCLAGDLNNDQRKELIIIDDDERMQVYNGDLEQVFTDKPTASLDIPGVNYIKASDLNQDNRDELLLFGMDENGRFQVTILWSK